MQEILQVVKMVDLILLSICIIPFTQIVKKFMPDDIESGWIMLVALVMGILFGILGSQLGIITTVQNGIIEGVLAGGICSGSLSLVFELIEKFKE